jgi:hypothetical protein
MTYLLVAWLAYLTHTTPAPFEIVRTSPLLATLDITMLFFLVFMAGFFTTALPCVLLHLFVGCYHIRHPLFDVVAGGMLGLTALALGCPFLSSTSTRPSGITGT